ncbi:hypothetical protein HOC35_01495 [Candidatus Woesearchaeota archaeon]|jgi:hypothetical protein|nr:hypothetical protein [Candidatus Woesearchaeota archaeon]
MIQEVVERLEREFGIDYEEFVRLMDDGKLHKILNPNGDVDKAKNVTLNDTIQSTILNDALLEVLGPSAKMDKEHTAYYPESLAGYLDLAYYTRLLRLEGDAIATKNEAVYHVARKNTNLCFYTRDNNIWEKETIVSLMQGVEFRKSIFYNIKQFAPKPDIEVVQLVDKDEVSVLDLGSGISPVALDVKMRLEDLGKQAKIYGITLKHLDGIPNELEKCYEGVFEYIDMINKFDILYSNIGASFYTPNTRKFLDKLLSVMNPGAVAILDITNHASWRRALTDKSIEYTFLKSIAETEIARAVKGKANPLYYSGSPKRLRRIKLPNNWGYKPLAVLIRKQ